MTLFDLLAAHQADSRQQADDERRRCEELVCRFLAGFEKMIGAPPGGVALQVIEDGIWLNEDALPSRRPPLLRGEDGRRYGAIRIKGDRCGMSRSNGVITHRFWVSAKPSGYDLQLGSAHYWDSTIDGLVEKACEGLLQTMRRSVVLQ